MADVGYFTLTDRVFVPFPASIAHGSQDLYRATVDWSVHGGLSNYPGNTFYLYWTDHTLHFDSADTQAGYERLPDGRYVDVCGEFMKGANAGVAITNAGIGGPGDPFSAQENILLHPLLGCASPEVEVSPKLLERLGISGKAELGAEERSGFINADPSGTRGVIVYVSIPVLVAGIDPLAEQRLVGLGGAMTSGSYLKEGTGLGGWTSLPGSSTNEKYRVLPLIASDKTYLDETAKVSIEKLSVPKGTDLAQALSAPSAYRFATHLGGKLVGETSLSPNKAWSEGLSGFENDSHVAYLSPGYWRVSPASYATEGDTLAPKVVVNPAKVWQTQAAGDFAPPGSNDTAYRHLSFVDQQEAFVEVGRTEHVLAPRKEVIGTFDPAKLEQFSALSKVPLQTFYPPTVSAAGPASARLLGKRPLGPTTNVAGYLTQPPLMLTTIKGAIALEDGDGEVRRIDGRTLAAFTTKPSISGSTPPISDKTPISVIEVRVAGVSGPNPTSLARIDLVAERIATETGLTVNVTAGSSPYDQRVHLAAGHFGQPAMNLEQHWVRLGVDSLIIEGLSGEDDALAVAVLAAALLFVASATAVALRGRRAEIATLRTLGFGATDIARLVVGESVAVGAAAGAAGLGAVVAIVAASGLVVPAARFALVVPVAVVLSGLGAAAPAWRAGAGAPVESLRGPRPPGAWRPEVRAPGGLALANLWRLRGRSVVAAGSLAISVLVASVVFGVLVAFGGGVAHSLLGDAVSFEVRGADLVSAGLVVAIGAVAMVDVRIAEMRERAAEAALLGALGWTPGQVARLAARESALLSVAGAGAGGLVGLIVLVALGGPIGLSVASVVAAVAAGAVLSMASLAIPLWRRSRIQPAGALSGE